MDKEEDPAAEAPGRLSSLCEKKKGLVPDRASNIFNPTLVRLMTPKISLLCVCVAACLDELDAAGRVLAKPFCLEAVGKIEKEPLSLCSEQV